jgi:YHS domain-containing protein
MKFLSLILLTIFTFALIGYAQEETTKTEPRDEQKEEVQIEQAAADTINVACTGCSMKMEKAKMVTLEKDGKIYYFCSEECKKNFLSKEEEKKEGCEKVKKEKKKECDKPKKE